MRAAGGRGEAAFAAALLALAVAALAAALAIPGAGPAAPGALPVAAAAVMVGAGAVNLAQAWRRRAPAGPGAARGWRTPAALALTAALAAGLAPAGFLIAGVLFLALTALLLGARPRVAALTALGVVGAVWAVFRLGFEVTLPTGPIPEAAWLAAVGDLLAGRP